MASFEITMDLPASPEASWAFIIDHGIEVEPLTFTPRAIQAPGVLNDLSGRLFGVLPFRAVSRTVAWEPPTRCAFESVTPTWPVRTSITELFPPVELHAGEQALPSPMSRVDEVSLDLAGQVPCDALGECR